MPAGLYTFVKSNSGFALAGVGGARFGAEASGPRVALVRAGFGGETSEALVSLARLGRVDSLLLVPWVVLGAVLGALAMVGSGTGFVCRGLLDSLLLPPVSLLVLLENTSTFDVGLPC